VSSDAWRMGTLEQRSDGTWTLSVAAEAPCVLVVGAPDELFAVGVGATSAEAMPGLRSQAPHWPQEYLRAFERRRISGDGTVAFDAAHFLEQLATSAVERPLLFPNGARKLGLSGLERTRSLLTALETTLRCGRVDVSHNAFAEALLRVERAETAAHAVSRARAARASPGDAKERAGGADGGADGGEQWAGRGRLIGLWPDGELAQIGSGVSDGVRLALGHGVVRARFAAGEALGVGLGPLALAEGRGAEVGEVDVGSAAERLGVQPGMVVVAIEADGAVIGAAARSAAAACGAMAGSSEGEDTSPDLSRLTSLPFEAVLAAIDAVRATESPLTLLLETATPTSHLYAVEMPAQPLFAALAASEAQHDTWRLEDADASGAVSALLAATEQPPPLWTEDATKAFIGDRSSLTCAHVDIAPDLELAHGLCGAKFVGVSTHDATPRLLADHAPCSAHYDDDDDDDDDVISTSVPTDRPLRTHEAALLGDVDVTLACVLPGDLCVFSSSALHFASNGASGLSGALFHGIVTEASLPRLREAATRGSAGDADQMSAEDVLNEIQRGHR
jgi:hypothetical protein